MCEIALLINDIISEDPINDSKMLKRGDVIEVLEDGANWGRMALTNPNFRMIKLEGISISEAMVLKASEMPTDSLQVSRMLRPRMFTLDLDHPSLIGCQELLQDDARLIPIGNMIKTLADQWIKDRITKPTLLDPDHLGQVTSRIG